MRTALQQNRELVEQILTANPDIFRDGFDSIRGVYVSFVAESASIVHEYAAGVQRSAASLNAQASNSLHQQQQQQQEEEEQKEKEQQQREEKGLRRISRGRHYA